MAWQKCPICDGEGKIGSKSLLKRPKCNICNGKGIISELTGKPPKNEKANDVEYHNLLPQVLVPREIIDKELTNVEYNNIRSCSNCIQLNKKECPFPELIFDSSKNKCDFHIYKVSELKNDKNQS